MSKACYKILSDPTAEALAEAVTAHVRAGFALVGAPFVVHNGTRLAQAVCRLDAHTPHYEKDMLGLLIRLRQNHPTTSNKLHGVSQLMSGEETANLWEEVDEMIKRVSGLV